LARLLLITSEIGIFGYLKDYKDKNQMMKKFKILFAAMALMVGSSAFAQKQAPSSSEQMKEGKELTMKDAAAKAKSFSKEMCTALELDAQKDKHLVQTISSINENYEVSLLRSTKKEDSSEQDLEAIQQKLETNRLRRFQGILTPEQVKMYQVWKAKMDAKAKK